MAHPVLPFDNLFVRPPGPPLRPDLSFSGAPRAADGKTGPPGPPPQAAWPCRSEHGAILLLVGMTAVKDALMSASPLRRLSGRFRLAVILTARHHGPGDPGQLVG